MITHEHSLRNKKTVAGNKKETPAQSIVPSVRTFSRLDLSYRSTTVYCMLCAIVFVTKPLYALSDTRSEFNVDPARRLSKWLTNLLHDMYNTTINAFNSYRTNSRNVFTARYASGRGTRYCKILQYVGTRYAFQRESLINATETRRALCTKPTPFCVPASSVISL